MILGEGMLRQCLSTSRGGCGLRLGCYQPNGAKLDCGACASGICPDTSDISHGLCEFCLEKALAYNRNLRRKPHH